MDTYTLPNGQKIDIDGVADAVLSPDVYPQHYFDIETGNVCVVESHEALARLVEQIGASDRYREITHFDDADYAEIMRDFIEEMLPDMAGDDLCRKIKKIFKKDGWQGVVAFLSTDEIDGLIHGWDYFINEEAWKLAEEWVTNIPGVPVVATFEGCSNCSLCALMRDGEGGDMKKLMHAFDVENTTQKVAQATSASKSEAMRNTKEGVRDGSNDVAED